MITPPQSSRANHRGASSSAVYATAWAFVAMLVLSSLVGATTYVMPTDQNLLDKSGLVVVATMESAEAAPGVSTPATDYQFRVERVLKGFVLATDIVVRVPGGPTADGEHFYKVHGTASFDRNKRAILFLTDEGGVFRVSDMELGAFLEGGIGSSRYAYRNISGGAVASSPNDAFAAERQRSYQPRDFDRFTQWIADRASGIQRTADYFMEQNVADGLVGVRQDFRNISFGCTGGDAIGRWREFDNNQTVTYRMWNAGQTGVPGGGFNQFSRGIQAWNNVSAARVNLRYGGTTTSNTGGTDPPNVDLNNRHIPGDPNNIIPNSFEANQGGTLAVTVAVVSCGNLLPFAGGLQAALVDADIISQDGIGTNFLPFQQDAALAYERVITHEIGHGLGFSHSCGGGIPCSGAAGAAIMRPDYVDSTLGRQLNSDDKNAARFTYPAQNSGGNVPAPPTDLVAEAISMSEIQLTWTDNSTDETSFTIQERSISAEDWSDLGTAAANATSIIVEGIPGRTARVYRVAATNSSGTSEFSNEAQATTNDEIGPCVVDDNTLCLAEDRFKITSQYLTQQGNSGMGTAGEITQDTGFFTFFEAANVEIVVKVLNACSFANRFWVFAGGLTNQQVELKVTDTESGTTNTYFNPLPRPYQPVQDNDAFATCP